MKRRGGGRAKQAADVFTKGAQSLGHLRLQEGPCFEFPGHLILAAGAAAFPPRLPK